MILTIRTDKPEAEIGIYENNEQRAYKTWHAHRQLGTTIHSTIKELLDSVNKSWNDIEGIVFFKGPGSFTGLRIGASIANALAENNQIPVLGRNGEDWIKVGLKGLAEGQNDHIALPEYGSEPHITLPRK